MISNDRLYRSFDFATDEEKEMVVRGIPVVFNNSTVLYKIDGVEYKEVIDARALENADISDVVLNIDHQGKPAAKTRNQTLKLEIRQDGLYMEADLSKNETGRELYEDIRNGFYDKMSFAFNVLEDEYNSETRTRTIKRIGKLYDVSAVTFPAYNTTTISARDFFEAEAEKEQKLAEVNELRKELQRKLLNYKLGGIKNAKN